MFPDDLRYNNSDEWVRAGDPATIGISYFAQDQLGDIVFVELPKVDTTLQAGDAFGTVESVKSSNELYTPVGGQVVEVNAALNDHPELVNSDPYGEGWMIKVRLADQSQLDALMDAATYERTRQAH